MNRFVDVTPMGPLVRVISGPWHGHGPDLPGLVALSVVAVVAGTVAASRLRRA